MPQIERNGSRLRVSGPMTMESAVGLLAESAGLIGAEKLEMDLSAVSEVDSAAISLMFEWLRQAREENGGLTFVSLPPNLVSLATLYGVLELIPHHTH